MRVTWTGALKNFARVKSIVLAVALMFTAQVGLAATFNNVNSDATLRNAINTINGSPGTSPLVTANTINITGNITVSSNLPVLLNGVTIHGGNFTINGNSQYRLFATSKSDLTLNNLTLQNGLAQGGGAHYGGGGLGAGGGVYIEPV